ncbi:MAG TPA: hypothetical protein ENH01_12285 [Nitrospirae bacterium]|nr:hypothetical protein [Nitrospirota bacterium]
MKINNAKDIHKYVEALINNMPLFKMPRYEALLHVLRTMEALFTRGSISERSEANLIMANRAFQDILRYMVYWTYSICPEGGKILSTPANCKEMIKETIEIAESYSKVFDFIKAEEMGDVSFNINKHSKIIGIEYLNEEAGRSFGLHEFFKGKELGNQSKNFFGNESGNMENMLKAKEEIEKSIKIKNKKEFIYSRSKFVFKTFEELSENIISQMFLMPEGWSLGFYTIGNFKLFWKHLLKIAIIHQVAFISYVEKMIKGNKNISYDNAVRCDNKKDLVNHIHMYSGLEKKVINNIIQDLIYDNAVKWTDIMFQPLFQIENKIIFSPNVIVGSRAERNINVLMSKINPTAYNDLTSNKEDGMISEFSNTLRENRYFFEPRVKLKEDDKVITDIDILVWDEKKENILLMQLKWLYGADATQEIYNQDKEFAAGIAQVKKSVNFIKRNSSYLSRFGLRPNNVFGIVISKLGLPSPFLNKENVILVESEQIIENLKAVPGNIKKLYTFLEQSSLPKKEIAECTLNVKEKIIGQYTFRLPVVSCKV